MSIAKDVPRVGVVASTTTRQARARARVEEPAAHGPALQIRISAITKTLRAAVALTALFGLITLTSATAATLPVALREALRQTGVPAEDVGLFVYDVGAAHPTFEHNADRPMNPASTMKLLTTLAGLELLGPTFTWRTEAWTEGRLTGDALDGNLILKGYGDPKLTLETFWLFLRELRARGLRQIRGDLLVDRSFFSVDEIDPGHFDNDPTRPYNVGPDALLVNFRSIRLEFLPMEQLGTVRILAMPDLSQITIGNQLTLITARCDGWPDKPLADWPQSRLTFSGAYPVACGERERSFSLLTRNQYLLALFSQLWRELGGTLKGIVRDGVVTEQSHWLASVESPPLAELIRDINKFSNNVMARQVFLTLSLAADNPPVTAAGAARALRAWLTRSHLDFAELEIENGSGLSRNERINARHLGELLLYAWRSPLMPEYVSSLPIPGVDGTLRRRLKDSPAAGRAHIKTGYLDGVRAIAGYVVDVRGHTVIVVSLINSPRAVNALGFQEAVVDWVWSGAPQSVH